MDCTTHSPSPTKNPITTRLDESLAHAAHPSPTAPSSPLLPLPVDRPDALVTLAWDALTLAGPPAVQHVVAQALKALASARAEEEEQGAKQEGGELGRVLEEGMREAMAPLDAVAMRAWEILHGRLVASCASALQGVKDVTATYRMTNKRPPERACPYVARVLEPLRAMEPDVKGRCVCRLFLLGWLSFE